MSALSNSAIAWQVDIGTYAIGRIGGVARPE
jgi:hypothetical protein